MNEAIISIRVIIQGIEVDNVTSGKSTKKNEKLIPHKPQIRPQNTKMGK